MSSAPRDENREVSLIAKSDADNTPVVVEADAATKRLKVSAVITSGGSAGAQYTDGDAAITHPIGTIPVFNNGGTITAVSAANPLPVSATISTAGLATSTKQSDGTQKTQVVDGSGNVISSTANALDINIKSGNPTTITATQSVAANLNATVVGTGTFATQSTLQTQTDTVMIGGVNIKEINAVAPLMGNGASGTGALRVSIANDSTGIVSLTTGTASIGKLAANSGVTIGDVNVVSNIPGTGATNLGKAEDAAHTTGDTGVMALGVRNDTLADTTNTNADYAQLSTDIKGRVMTAGAPRSLKGTAQVSLSATTSETTIITATASTFHDVYGVILANTGATTTKVSIRDDTAGTVRAIIEVPTLETRGFMLPVDSAVPQTAVNKNWTAQCGSSTTALEVTMLYVSMV